MKKIIAAAALILSFGAIAALQTATDTVVDPVSTDTGTTGASESVQTTATADARTVAAALTTPGFDTSHAVESSYSCLSGGCHETNAALVDGYARSVMTHANVKCNACHGTHTATTLGADKPNLTGYYPGIGPTGYVVGKDRCVACHSATLARASHPHNPASCTGCHAPHAFAPRQ